MQDPEYAPLLDDAIYQERRRGFPQGIRWVRVAACCSPVWVVCDEAAATGAPPRLPAVHQVSGIRCLAARVCCVC